MSHQQEKQPNRLFVVRVLRHMQLELKSCSNSFVSSCRTTLEPLILDGVKLGRSLETSTSIILWPTENDTRSLDFSVLRVAHSALISGQPHGGLEKRPSEPIETSLGSTRLENTQEI